MVCKYVEPPRRAVDNCYGSYHSMLKDNFPKSNSTKAIVEECLKNKNIEFSPQERLSELRERVKSLIPMYKRYELDEIALEMDHKVIRLPPYHCQYNPIELIWAKVKGEVAKNNNTFKMADVEKLAHAAMDAVTQEDWKKCVAHAEKIQDNRKEILRDVMLEPIIITLRDDDSDWGDEQDDDDDVFDADIYKNSCLNYNKLVCIYLNFNYFL